MNSVKFYRLVREFSFLASIIDENQRAAHVLPCGKLPLYEYVEDIKVSRADQNLLEVTPGGWAHDLGEWGDDEGYRHFWVSSFEEILPLKSSWVRSQVPHGITAHDSADQIGVQLIKLNRDVQFIVEISEDRSFALYQDAQPVVIVYKMKEFDWRRFSALLTKKR